MSNNPPVLPPPSRYIWPDWSKRIKCPKCYSVIYWELIDAFKASDGIAVINIKCTLCKNVLTINFDCSGGVATLNLTIPYQKINYGEYINSPEWKGRSNNAKDSAGHRCQLCNKAGNNRELHTHHRTYERLGNELPEDLIVLCAGCHAKFHDKDQP
jgi:5-methylcytosine-specific restriction endonuclease McrA